MSPKRRSTIVIIAAVLLVTSLAVTFWIGGESRRCAADAQIYRFGRGCVRPAPAILLERGLRRTRLNSIGKPRSEKTRSTHSVHGHLTSRDNRSIDALVRLCYGTEALKTHRPISDHQQDTPL